MTRTGIPLAGIPIAMILFTAFALLNSPQNSLAQSGGDAVAGKLVASSLCVQCHRIDGVDRSPDRVPPNFGAIADMASQTETSLRVFLRTPHGDMPRYQFTGPETEDVIAYIRSLRSR